MALSIFTTVTNPEARGDNYKDALACYKDLADEVVVIDGAKTWPKEFTWPIIGEHFQKGYEKCIGDVVIHCDLDFIFHENDFQNIRKAAQEMLDKKLVGMTMWKYLFVLPDRYNLKSRLVTMVNKRDYGDRIRFDSGGDLCQPSLDGKHINPTDTPEARVPFYCYDKLTKTKDQVKDDQGRMERAYFRHFTHYQLAETDSDDSAYYGWIRMQTGRFNKPSKHIKLNEHPKYVQGTIKNLAPEQWGYSGFDILGKNDYVEEIKC